MYIKDLGTHCVRDRQSFLHPSAQQNTGKWDGSKQSQGKKKDYQAQGVGARTRGNSANGAAHHGGGVGKDGDLSRKGLRNQ